MADEHNLPWRADLALPIASRLIRAQLGRYGNKDGGVYWEEMLLPDEPADAKL